MTTRMIVLEALQSGPKSPKDIAKMSGKAYSTICGAIEVLEAKGLIEEHSRRPAKTKPETVFLIKEQNNGMA